MGKLCVYGIFYICFIPQTVMCIKKILKNIIQFSMVLLVMNCLPLLTCVVSALTLQDV